MKIEIWYTIEKHNGEWTVWMNKMGEKSCGSLGVYTAKHKKDCIEYCKNKGIKVEKK